MTSKTLISLNLVNKYFDNDHQTIHALKDISMTVREGEFMMLLGPSGSGKSTLLRLLAHLDMPSSGTIEHHKDIKASFIFQDFALFPWLTVAENVGFGLHMAGMSRHEQQHIISEQIAQMGLRGFENSYPRELSGGMKQRVGIARALAVSPKIIYLDEPFSALDSFTAHKLRQELMDIAKAQQLTVVMVTHLIEEAVQMGDRIIVLSQRPATVAKTVTNTLSRPRNVRGTHFFEFVDRITKVIKM